MQFYTRLSLGGGVNYTMEHVVVVMVGGVWVEWCSMVTVVNSDVWWCVVGDWAAYPPAHHALHMEGGRKD